MPQIPRIVTDTDYRKGGRVLTVTRDAKSKKEADKLHVRILCVPPHVPRHTAQFQATMHEDEKSQGFDISLLYRLIL